MKTYDADRNGGRTWSGRECWIAGGSVAAGAALGLAAMYLFDPDRGKGRRNQLRDRTESKLRHAKEQAVGRVEDLVHRATGAVREACAGGCCSEGVSDDVLRDRVRSKLGHLVTPPDHVETDVRRGVVALRGTASSTDREALLKGLRRIPGVRGVEDLLVATAV